MHVIALLGSILADHPSGMPRAIIAECIAMASNMSLVSSRLRSNFRSHTMPLVKQACDDISKYSADDDIHMKTCASVDTAVMQKVTDRLEVAIATGVLETVYNCFLAVNADHGNHPIAFGAIHSKADPTATNDDEQALCCNLAKRMHDALLSGINLVVKHHYAFASYVGSFADGRRPRDQHVSLSQGSNSSGGEAEEADSLVWCETFLGVLESYCSPVEKLVDAVRSRVAVLRMCGEASETLAFIEDGANQATIGVAKWADIHQRAMPVQDCM